MNDNGLLLLTMCTENDLTITNSLFRMANKYKTTWMHPRSKHWHLIDYIIVRKRDIRDVKITRAMRGAECWTDHRLVRSILSMHLVLAHRKKPKLTRAKFNTAKLADSNIEHDLLNGDPEERWTHLKRIMSESSKEVLGLKERVHQDWFDENSEEIIQEKHKAYMEWQNDESKRDNFKRLQSKFQRELRYMEDKWWDQKADE